MKAVKGGNGSGQRHSTSAEEKLRRKDYDKALARLHVELVKLEGTGSRSILSSSSTSAIEVDG
jgi:hypothetical protein